jgi:hypothetical protein
LYGVSPDQISYDVLQHANPGMFGANDINGVTSAGANRNGQVGNANPVMAPFQLQFNQGFFLLSRAKCLLMCFFRWTRAAVEQHKHYFSTIALWIGEHARSRNELIRCQACPPKSWSYIYRIIRGNASTTVVAVALAAILYREFASGNAFRAHVVKTHITAASWTAANTWRSESTTRSDQWSGTTAVDCGQCPTARFHK